jgi:hypothetical protein
VGFVLLIAADNMQIRLTDKQIADAITSLEGKVLEIRWLIGEMNSMKKRLSVYLEEGINQMVGDIPRPLFINKLNQEVMWRTESKLALVAIALIVLGGIYGMSNKSNNRKADAIAVLMENGEVDSYNNVLFYTANDEQMDQRTLSALSYLSRGYDMVQVYNKMSDYNDKVMVC